MLDRLRTFLEVYRHRSMGRAAEALSLTQPAVSNQIAALEREFGAPLFERSRGGVVPTVVADSLAKDVAPALDALETTIGDRLKRSARLTGLIHLGAPPEFFSVYGGQILASLAETDVRVQAHLGGQEQLHRGLYDGSLDIILLASCPPGRTYSKEQIGEERLRLLAHPMLAERIRGRKVTAGLLEELPFVAYDQDLSLIRQYFEAVFGQTCGARPVVVAPDLRAIASICAARPAWTVLPDYLSGPLQARHQLVRLSPGDKVENPFYIVVQRTALRTPRIAFARNAIISAWQPVD